MSILPRGELLTLQHWYLLAFYKATLFTTPLLVHVKLLWNVPAQTYTLCPALIRTDCYDRNLNVVHRYCQAFYEAGNETLPADLRSLRVIRLDTEQLGSDDRERILTSQMSIFMVTCQTMTWIISAISS